MLPQVTTVVGVKAKTGGHITFGMLVSRRIRFSIDLGVVSRLR